MRHGASFYLVLRQKQNQMHITGVRVVRRRAGLENARSSRCGRTMPGAAGSPLALADPAGGSNSANNNGTFPACQEKKRAPTCTTLLGSSVSANFTTP